MARWGFAGGQEATKAYRVAKVEKEKCLEHADYRLLDEIEKKMKRPSDLKSLKAMGEKRYDICKFEIQFFNHSNAEIPQAHEKAKTANNKCLSQVYDNLYGKAKNNQGSFYKTKKIRSEVSKKCQKRIQDLERHPKSSFHVTIAITSLVGMVSSVYQLYRRFF